MTNITKAINESIELHNQQHAEPKLMGFRRDRLQKWLMATFYGHAGRFIDEKAVKDAVMPIISVYVTNDFSLEKANEWISGIDALALVEVPRWLKSELGDANNYYDKNYPKIYRRDGLFCVYCGVGLTTARVELDHLFPKFLFRAGSLGNPNVSANVVCSCGSCNSKKDNYYIVGGDGSNPGPWNSRRLYIEGIRKYIESTSEDPEVKGCASGISYRTELSLGNHILHHAQEFWAQHAEQDMEWLASANMLSQVQDYWSEPSGSDQPTA